MAIKSATGLVIRKVNFKDSDYVATLFGREAGKFSGIAKGARKLESKFGGVFDLLNKVEVVYYQGSGLDFFSEAEVIENWEKIKQSGSAINAGLRSARAINKLLEDGQREKGAYDLMEATLYSLGGTKARPDVIELGFYLKLFRALGYQPQLGNCSSCGQSVDSQESHNFLPETGGILCHDCSSSRGFPVSAGTRKVLVKLTGIPQDEVSRLKVSEGQLKEGFSLLDRFGQYHFGQKLISSSGAGAGTR